MELSATAKVILGMLAARPRSGYEIKQLVDSSARFFWLVDAGMITGADASQGARQRTVYKLTAKGRRAAREWIATEPQVFELRDEGLLKLFFSDGCSLRSSRSVMVTASSAAATLTPRRGFTQM